ncbi:MULTISPECIES: MGH1-like glycoside hydrolase domain-containing protein [Dysgonomonas]|uniref:MGH1-like glycoside hydrolase domain-containing protein n=1 Tax=Dysgonomonas TaxID=156973 RepID=UPI0009263F33|nr:MULTISPECIES: trehalase family glycosidase [Dysgonomonas]MBN9302544.1 hypothetical protein [Dysgonomonas mossii]OJX59476.1 MAG: hypothetical protein BGO84_12040 [Dysgonomonas sp. 37-18]
MKIRILLLFATLFICLNSVSGSEKRGIYFAKKKSEIPSSLPQYEDIKNLLPVPILEENPEWEILYWKAWEIAFSNLMLPPEGSPFTAPWIDEGLSPQIFQWDTNLIMFFGRYAYHIFPFINSHDNFYAQQHPDGMICRVINEADGADHVWGLGPNNARSINPPLFGWAEVEMYKFTGDKSRLALVLPVLEKYAEWIDKNRIDKNSPHQLYWSNGQASGMDNTLRDRGRPAPAPDCDEHSAIDPVGWVDMSSQMAMLYENLSFITNELGCKTKARQYDEKSREIIKRINQFMWNEETGLYHDVDVDGVQTPWKTVAAFWPMLANASNPAQTRRMVENITDPSLFWRLLPLPSLAADQETYSVVGKYWLGGVWAPTSYMVVKGLQQEGYNDLAYSISEKFLQSMDQVYQKTHTIWECYSPDIYMPSVNESGIMLCKPNFVGWSGLVPISMLIENIIGINVDGYTNSIKWNLHRTDRHGIENLRFREVITSLIYEPENKIVRVVSNNSYLLHVHDKIFDVKSGENIFKL